MNQNYLKPNALQRVPFQILRIVITELFSCGFTKRVEPWQSNQDVENKEHSDEITRDSVRARVGSLPVRRSIKGVDFQNLPRVTMWMFSNTTTNCQYEQFITRKRNYFIAIYDN